MAARYEVYVPQGPHAPEDHQFTASAYSIDGGRVLPILGQRAEAPDPSARYRAIQARVGYL